MEGTTSQIGPLIREWRRRRSLSQLALAAEADVSQRHLSFIESGRSAPSRDMVIRLADRLAVPVRERNTMLAAAGFAPVYRLRAPDDPELRPATQAVERILRGHEPYPALAVDRHWRMVLANRAVPPLLAGVDAALLEPPVNVLRVSLHPDGLASRILNFREWRAHVIARLAAQIDHTADPDLAALRTELQSYPTPPGALPYRPGAPSNFSRIATPFRLATDAGELSLITTTTVFGTALDITMSELAIEAFFPADPATAERLARLTPPA